MNKYSIDGKQAGDILYPYGEVDLTSLCRPGGKHVLSMQVTALPLSDVVAVFSDSNAPRRARGEVSLASRQERVSPT